MAGMIAHHNRVYGTTHKREHFSSFHLHVTLGCTPEEAGRRVSEFFHSDEHQEILPIEGAVSALTILSRDYEPIGITAREKSAEHRTIELVRKHFNNLFSEFRFVGHLKSKGEVCEEIGASFMVDDALHNAISVSAYGIPVFLLDTPWNQGALPRGVVRVKSWEELLLFLGYNTP